MDTTDKKPFVGVSQCLLGDAVRYDGQSKSNAIVLQQLSVLFELVPVCPEVESGLGIPRPPVQLTVSIEQPRVTGRDDPSLDVTTILNHYCDNKMPGLKHLTGFIFKSRSPSCGLNSTPVFIGGKCVTETSRGIFARNLCLHYPELSVIEDSQLEDTKILNNFIKSVIQNC